MFIDTLANKIKKIMTYVNEITRINSQKSICIVKSKNYSIYEKEMYFKFDVLGASLDLNLPASSIVKHKPLLERFSSDDKNEIIFYSGICCYKITDSSLNDNGKWLITVQATLGDNNYSKKFFPEEILGDKMLFSLLSPKEKSYIFSLSSEDKVIPFIKVSSMNSIAL